jgi:hypothetical protein
VNVEVATLVPAAAANVTFTPLCQLLLLSVTDVGVAVIAVLPVRVSATVTGLEGAAFKRMVEVPLAPPITDKLLGVAVIVGVTVPCMVKGTLVLAVLNAGEPLSKAVA